MALVEGVEGVEGDEALAVEGGGKSVGWCRVETMVRKTQAVDRIKVSRPLR